MAQFRREMSKSGKRIQVFPFLCFDRAPVLFEKKAEMPTAKTKRYSVPVLCSNPIDPLPFSLANVSTIYSPPMNTYGHCTQIEASYSCPCLEISYERWRRERSTQHCCYTHGRKKERGYITVSLCCININH